MKPEEFAVIYTPNAKKDDERYRRWYATEQWKQLGAARRRGTSSSISTRTVISIAEAHSAEENNQRVQESGEAAEAADRHRHAAHGLRRPGRAGDVPRQAAEGREASAGDHAHQPSLAWRRRRICGIIVDYWAIFENFRRRSGVLPRRRRHSPCSILEPARGFPGAPRRGARARRRPAGRGRVRADDVARPPLHRRSRRRGAVRGAVPRRSQSAFEALAPDPSLSDHLDDYRRLVRLRGSGATAPGSTRAATSTSTTTGRRRTRSSKTRCR